MHESKRSRLANATAILVEITRAYEVESLHHGAIAVANPAGETVAWCGNPDLTTYMRSATKPFQALALFSSGAVERFDIPPEELAIAIASHSGEEFHLRLVDSLAKRAGVKAEWLQCGPHPPYDRLARETMLRLGDAATPMHNNCSGKHTGMLAASIALGAPTETYLDSHHPVQAQIREILSTLTELPSEQIKMGVDGCSAPNFFFPLSRFATALARLAACGATGATEPVRGMKAVWDAMVAHPDVIAGTEDRLDTDLMISAREAGLPLIAKSGVEGTFGLGVVSPFGPLGIALKIEDGSIRGRDCAAIETLAQLGALPEPVAAVVERYHRPILRNLAGLAVGEVRACFRLHWPTGPARR